MDIKCFDISLSSVLEFLQIYSEHKMKHISKLFGFALLLSFAQIALASADPCGVVNDLKGTIDKTSAAIASGSGDQLEAAAKEIGIRLPSGGEAVMRKALQYEEGLLYKTMQVAKLACDHERETAAAAKKAADTTGHLAWELSHRLRWHCAMYDHGLHRLCRMGN